jgi:CAAX protease family protein
LGRILAGLRRKISAAGFFAGRLGAGRSGDYLYQMIGAIVELLLSWALLHFIEHRNLSVLGFRPTSRRLRLAGLGFLLGAGYLTVFYLVQAALLDNPYHLNTAYGLPAMLKGLWYVFKSVLFEELIFRGALLYILIKRIGPSKAVLISAIAFGIYHWFTIGFGKPTQMLYIFLVMGLAGCAFAKAFEKTGTILLPFALHFGFNFAIMILFSQNSGIGPQLFVQGPAPHVTTGSLLFLLFMIGQSFVPPLLVLFWLRFVKRASF